MGAYSRGPPPLIAKNELLHGGVSKGGLIEWRVLNLGLKVTSFRESFLLILDMQLKIRDRNLEWVKIILL